MLLVPVLLGWLTHCLSRYWVEPLLPYFQESFRWCRSSVSTSSYSMPLLWHPIETPEFSSTGFTFCHMNVFGFYRCSQYRDAFMWLSLSSSFMPTSPPLPEMMTRPSRSALCSSHNAIGVGFALVLPWAHCTVTSKSPFCNGRFWSLYTFSQSLMFVPVQRVALWQEPIKSRVSVCCPYCRWSSDVENLVLWMLFHVDFSGMWTRLFG